MDDAKLLRLIDKYGLELEESLIHLRNGHWRKVKQRYRDWTLRDCEDMFNFYDDIECGHLRKAYNKLDELFKRDSLVPSEIADELYTRFNKF